MKGKGIFIILGAAVLGIVAFFVVRSMGSGGRRGDPLNEGIAGMLNAVINPVIGLVNAVTEPVVDIVEGTFGFVTDVGGAIGDVGEGIYDVAGDVLSVPGKVAGAVGGAVSDAWNAIF